MSEVKEIGNIEHRYEILGLIGDGGYGDLYAGRGREHGEKVAVKTQKPWRMGPRVHHQSDGEKLIDEGHLMRNLSGIEAIPELIAAGTYKDDRCLVMEFIEGRQLRDVLAAKRPVRDPGTVASIIGQLCETLWEVHRKELVHCDLKPENVMVEPDGRLRLIDMGRAVQIGRETLDVHGTTGYAAPEQLEENRDGLTEQADIFGLGCILLEMTVLRPPYGGPERRVCRGYPVLPPDRIASIPQQFRDLALQMVQWDAADRPADVREVFEHIRPYLPTLGSRRPQKPLSPDPTEYYRTHPARL
ncbi:serine/threonine-protein kinase [Streptomyces sp. NPDC005962]|uniref:serine/threonine protein kinase n=1 Tax=Streptomyces sp. NPDC005962 TaxID=3154466 RepID=UPI0033DECFE4